MGRRLEVYGGDLIWYPRGPLVCCRHPPELGADPASHSTKLQLLVMIALYLLFSLQLGQIRRLTLYSLERLRGTWVGNILPIDKFIVFHIYIGWTLAFLGSAYSPSSMRDLCCSLIPYESFFHQDTSRVTLSMPIILRMWRLLSAWLSSASLLPAPLLQPSGIGSIPHFVLDPDILEGFMLISRLGILHSSLCQDGLV